MSLIKLLNFKFKEIPKHGIIIPSEIILTLIRDPKDLNSYLKNLMICKLENNSLILDKQRDKKIKEKILETLPSFIYTNKKVYQLENNSYTPIAGELKKTKLDELILSIQNEIPFPQLNRYLTKPSTKGIKPEIYIITDKLSKIQFNF